MKTQGFMVIVMGALLAGHAATSVAEEPAHDMGMMAETCPMQVPGTTVSSEPVTNGAALVFATQTGDVADLRLRVRRMADMHNQHRGGKMAGEHAAAGAAANHQQHQGTSGDNDKAAHGKMMSGHDMVMSAATTSVVDTSDGATLVFSLQPKDLSRLDALREQVQARATHASHGGCPLMSPAGKAQVTDKGAGSVDHAAHHPTAPAK